MQKYTKGYGKSVDPWGRTEAEINARVDYFTRDFERAFRRAVVEFQNQKEKENARSRR